MFNLDDQTLEPWLERARCCAQLMISEVASSRRISVADVGCGDAKLKRALDDAGIDCDYRGFDLLPQSPAVAAFDVAEDHLPGRFDFAVMLGVIEYLEDVTMSLGRLRPLVDYIVLSHVAKDMNSYTASDLERLGWRTHLDRSEVEQALARAGFTAIRSAPTREGKTMLWLAKATS